MLNPIGPNKNNFPVKKTSSLTWIKSQISHAKTSISTLLANASARYAKIAPSDNMRSSASITISIVTLPSREGSLRKARL